MPPNLVKSQPNYIDILTLLVLSLTLIGVWVYAWESRRANDLLEYSVRPFLKHSVSKWLFTSASHEKILDKIYLDDVGRIPAGGATTMGEILFSPTDRVAQFKPQTLLEERTVFPVATLLADAPIIVSSGDMAADEVTTLLDQKKGKGWLFVVVLTTYGNGSYSTFTCWEFALPSRNPTPCLPPNSDYWR